MRTRTIIGISIIALMLIVTFLLNSRRNINEALTGVGQQTNATSEETEKDFIKQEELKTNLLTISSYGGSKDVKTIEINGYEFALTRNPKIVTDLNFAISNLLGDYYFAEDINGNKIIYKDGTPEGRFGINEVGLVSGKLTRTRNTQTEYFAAYPDLLSCEVLGLPPIEDTGQANNFLKTQYLKITNRNSNVSVIVEIDTRWNDSKTLLVSEAVRKSLGLDNEAKGNLELQLVPVEENKLGPIRINL
jgi:hypothetical protein